MTSTNQSHHHPQENQQQQHEQQQQQQQYSKGYHAEQPIDLLDMSLDEDDSFVPDSMKQMFQEAHATLSHSHQEFLQAGASPKRTASLQPNVDLFSPWNSPPPNPAAHVTAPPSDLLARRTASQGSERKQPNQHDQSSNIHGNYHPKDNPPTTSSSSSSTKQKETGARATMEDANAPAAEDLWDAWLSTTTTNTIITTTTPSATTTAVAAVATTMPLTNVQATEQTPTPNESVPSTTAGSGGIFGLNLMGRMRATMSPTKTTPTMPQTPFSTTTPETQRNVLPSTSNDPFAHVPPMQPSRDNIPRDSTPNISLTPTSTVTQQYEPSIQTPVIAPDAASSKATRDTPYTQPVSHQDSRQVHSTAPGTTPSGESRASPLGRSTPTITASPTRTATPNQSQTPWTTSSATNNQVTPVNSAVAKTVVKEPSDAITNVTSSLTTPAAALSTKPVLSNDPNHLPVSRDPVTPTLPPTNKPENETTSGSIPPKTQTNTSTSQHTPGLLERITLSTSAMRLSPARTPVTTSSPDMDIERHEPVAQRPSTADDTTLEQKPSFPEELLPLNVGLGDPTKETAQAPQPEPPDLQTVQISLPKTEPAETDLKFKVDSKANVSKTSLKAKTLVSTTKVMAPAETKSRKQNMKELKPRESGNDDQNKTIASTTKEPKVAKPERNYKAIIPTRSIQPSPPTTSRRVGPVYINKAPKTPVVTVATPAVRSNSPSPLASPPTTAAPLSTSVKPISLSNRLLKPTTASTLKNESSIANKTSISAEEGQRRAQERIRQRQIEAKKAALTTAASTHKPRISIAPLKTATKVALTRPHGPKFATDAKYGEKKVEKKLEPTLAQSSVLFGRGLRHDEPAPSKPSQSRPSRTIPKAPKFATDTRLGPSKPSLVMKSSSREGRDDHSLASRASNSSLKRSLTIPHAPKFATSAKLGEKSNVRRESTPRDIPLARCSDVYAKGLRDSNPSPITRSTHRTGLTVPKPFHFNISSRPAETPACETTAQRETSSKRVPKTPSASLISRLSKPTAASVARKEKVHKTSDQVLLETLRHESALSTSKPRTGPTIPKPFKLRSEARASHYTLPAPSPKKEDEDLKEIKTFAFHARPMPNFRQPAVSPKSQFTARAPDKFAHVKPPNLSTSLRMDRRKAAEDASMRNAEKLAKEKELQAKIRQRELHIAAILKSEARAPVPSGKPFQLHSSLRHEVAKKKLEEQRRQEEEDEKQKNTFHARPYRPTPKPERITTTKVTAPTPFHLGSVARHEVYDEERRRQQAEEEEEARRQSTFKARPVPKSTYVPHKNISPDKRPLVDPFSPEFVMKQRSKDRHAYDERSRQEREAAEAHRRAIEEQRRAEEEADLKERRQLPVSEGGLMFVAQPVNAVFLEQQQQQMSQSYEEESFFD